MEPGLQRHIRETVARKLTGDFPENASHDNLSELRIVAHCQDPVRAL